MTKQLKTIDDLKPAKYNPRSIKADAAEALGESIKAFGDISGIVWNQRTGNLVAGHQRVDAIRKAGGQLIEKDGAAQLVVQDGKRFAVRVVDWDVGTEKAANITANNPHIAGVFTTDVDALLREVQGTIGEEQFGALALDDLLEEVEASMPKGAADVEQDEVPEPPANPVTKPGDVWVLGDHTVVCGDCREVTYQEYDLLVTDPPYGVSYADKNSFLNAVDEGNRNQSEIAGDHMAPEQMSDLWLAAFSAVRNGAKPGASYYITGPQGGDLLLLLLALKAADFPLRHMLIWAKNNHVLGRADYNYKHEPILYGWVKGSHRWVGEGGEETSLWQVDKPHSSKEHPTMKPVALFAKAIGNSCQRGGLVADPFLGSGTTLIAAENLGRRCFGVEIEPKYVDVVCGRWAKLTGGDPVRKSDGAKFRSLCDV